MNKLSSTFLAIIVFSTIGFSQSFEVHFEDTSASGPPNTELIIEGVINNISNNPIVVFITRENQNLPDYWSSSLCFRSCFAPWISTISDTIAAGAGLTFSIHFNTSITPGSGSTILSVALENDVEKTYFNLSATTISTGLNATQITVKHFRLNGNYPNPFNGETVIQFETGPATKKACLSIYDISGKELFSDQFSTTHGINRYYLNMEKISDKTLASGLYFYKITILNDQGRFHPLFGKFNLIK